jgi:hypothetical protein
MIQHLLSSLQRYCSELYVEARITSSLMKAIVDTLKSATGIASSAAAGPQAVENLARTRPDYQSALQGCENATIQINALKAMLTELAMYQPEAVSSASSSSMPVLVDGKVVQQLHDCIAVFEAAELPGGKRKSPASTGAKSAAPVDGSKRSKTQQPGP